MIDPFKHGVKTMRYVWEIIFILMCLALMTTALNLFRGA
jgi:hypothetical protein